MTPSPKPKDPLEEFSENPLDIFSFYVGLLRDTIREVSPETWWGLLGKTPQLKTDGSLDLQKWVHPREMEGSLFSQENSQVVQDTQGSHPPTENPENWDNGCIT